MAAGVENMHCLEVHELARDLLQQHIAPLNEVIASVEAAAAGSRMEGSTQGRTVPSGICAYGSPFPSDCNIRLVRPLGSENMRLLKQLLERCIAAWDEEQLALPDPRQSCIADAVRTSARGPPKSYRLFSKARTDACKLCRDTTDKMQSHFGAREAGSSALGCGLPSARLPAFPCVAHRATEFLKRFVKHTRCAYKCASDICSHFHDTEQEQVVLEEWLRRFAAERRKAAVMTPTDAVQYATLLLSDPSEHGARARSFVAERFLQLHVDEVQSTTPPQWEFLSAVLRAMAPEAAVRLPDRSVVGGPQLFVEPSGHMLVSPNVFASGLELEPFAEVATAVSASSASSSVVASDRHKLLAPWMASSSPRVAQLRRALAADGIIGPFVTLYGGDECIDSWQGADASTVSIIAGMFPKMNVFALTRNYRSQAHIATVTNAVRESVANPAEPIALAAEQASADAAKLDGSFHSGRLDWIDPTSAASPMKHAGAETLKQRVLHSGAFGLQPTLSAARPKDEAAHSALVSAQAVAAGHVVPGGLDDTSKSASRSYHGASAAEKSSQVHIAAEAAAAPMRAASSAGASSEPIRFYCGAGYASQVQLEYVEDETQALARVAHYVLLRCSSGGLLGSDVGRKLLSQAAEDNDALRMMLSVLNETHSPIPLDQVAVITRFNSQADVAAAFLMGFGLTVQRRVAIPGVTVPMSSVSDGSASSASSASSAGTRDIKRPRGSAAAETDEIDETLRVSQSTMMSSASTGSFASGAAAGAAAAYEGEVRGSQIDGDDEYDEDADEGGNAGSSRHTRALIEHAYQQGLLMRQAVDGLLQRLDAVSSSDASASAGATATFPDSFGSEIAGTAASACSELSIAAAGGTRIAPAGASFGVPGGVAGAGSHGIGIGIWVGMVHASKGKGWHTVFLPFFHEGSSPAQQAVAQPPGRDLTDAGLARARQHMDLVAFDGSHLQPLPLSSAAFELRFRDVRASSGGVGSESLHVDSKNGAASSAGSSSRLQAAAAIVSSTAVGGAGIASPPRRLAGTPSRPSQAAAVTPSRATGYPMPRFSSPNKSDARTSSAGSSSMGSSWSPPRSYGSIDRVGTDSLGRPVFSNPISGKWREAEKAAQPRAFWKSEEELRIMAVALSRAGSQLILLRPLSRSMAVDSSPWSSSGGGGGGLPMKRARDGAASSCTVTKASTSPSRYEAILARPDILGQHLLIRDLTLTHVRHEDLPGPLQQMWLASQARDRRPAAAPVRPAARGDAGAPSSGCCSGDAASSFPEASCSEESFVAVRGSSLLEGSAAGLATGTASSHAIRYLCTRMHAVASTISTAGSSAGRFGAPSHGDFTRVSLVTLLPVPLMTDAALL